MVTMMDFPDTQIVKDADKANYQNYLAWQAQTAERRKQAQTQFNMFQSRSIERMCSQHQFKEEIAREVESNKDAVERRLSRACTCDNCYQRLLKSRTNSDESGLSAPLSPTDTRRSLDSLTTRSSRSPLGTTVKDSPSTRSRNSLVVSPPPRSRHHQRKCQRQEIS